jgi:hypothetical protein
MQPWQQLTSSTLEVPSHSLFAARSRLLQYRTDKPNSPWTAPRLPAVRRDVTNRCCGPATEDPPPPPAPLRTDAAVLLSVLDASPLATLTSPHPLPSLPAAAHRTNHPRADPRTATQNFLLNPTVTVHQTFPYYYCAVRSHPESPTNQPNPPGQPTSPSAARRAAAAPAGTEAAAETQRGGAGS